MNDNNEEAFGSDAGPLAKPSAKVAVATQFELRRWTLYPRMFKLTYQIMAQAKRSKGLIYMSISPISLRTLTVWASMDAMVAFRNSGAHDMAMGVTWQLGRNNSVTWHTDYVPSQREAHRKLAQRKRAQSKRRLSRNPKLKTRP